MSERQSGSSIFPPRPDYGPAVSGEIRLPERSNNPLIGGPSSMPSGVPNLMEAQAAQAALQNQSAAIQSWPSSNEGVGSPAACDKERLHYLRDRRSGIWMVGRWVPRNHFRVGHWVVTVEGHGAAIVPPEVAKERFSYGMVLPMPPGVEN